MDPVDHVRDGERVEQPRPSLTFAALTFSDGTKIDLRPEDVVVFVGPNNAGKSAALRELERLVGRPQKLTVLHDAEVSKVGSFENLISTLKSTSIVTEQSSIPFYNGYGYRIQSNVLEHWWAHDQSELRSFFCARVPTETRILDSNPPSNIATLKEPPQHPIHLLQADDRIAAHISGHFRRAFGEELMVFHGGGSQVPLFVGQLPSFEPGEDRISATYLQRLRSTAVPLEQQGDGMRSFVSVVLNMLASENPTVMLLDEPEAFLHPPQARLLGEVIAKERRPGCQLFIATHSPDVLQGLLDGASGDLRVLRIQRRADVNHVRELDRARTSDIARDPLLKYSQVFQGIFHEHVFICESDADCLFYSSLLDLEVTRGERQPDALFIHAGGKHRMGKLADALRALDVPVSIVADMDLLNDERTFSGLFVTLGGDWEAIRDDWRSVKTAIEEHKPWLNAAEIAEQIRRELEGIPTTGEFPKDRRQRIEKVFRKASPWDAIKQGGKANIPAGQATQKYNRLDAACRWVGLWIVPTGELEGFCRSVEASHGPAWVQKVLEEKDLSTEPELGEARSFVQAIWARARR